jgi:succinate dehydrogenase flavin-adding protein (antitoxin of CptAB toxin-antitoxin module)
MDAYRHNKLKWKCRRGLLELDLVLDRFFSHNQVGDKEASDLENLLDLPDNDLLNIVMGRSNDYDPRLTDLVARLRAA